MSSLEGKTALVLGGSGDIGRIIVKRLLNEGMRVIISARTQSKLDAVAEELGSDKLSVVAADASDMDAVERLFGDAKRRYEDSLDLVVIASGGYSSLTLKETPQEAAGFIKKMIEGNLIAAANVGYVAGQVMSKQGSGLIINISSHAAVRVLPGGMAYGAAKAGIRWFFLNLAAELREKGIKVTDIQPSTVNTASMADKLRKENQHLTIQPKDIAKKIVELATDGSHTHTPEVLLDGDYQF